MNEGDAQTIIKVMFCEHPLQRYPLRRTYVHRAPSYTDFVNTWKTEDGISTSLKNYNAEK